MARLLAGAVLWVFVLLCVFLGSELENPSGKELPLHQCHWWELTFSMWLGKYCSLLSNLYYYYSLGHMLQIMLGLVIFNVCYILNFLKAKQMSRIGMALFNVDVELMRLAAPCKDLVDHKKGQRHKWIFILMCVAFFAFMVVFDCLVFREYVEA